MRLLIVQSCVPTHGCLSTASARISAPLPAFRRGECDQRVDQAIKDGVNVVIWFSLTFENRAEALITSSVAPQCVQESVKRLKAADVFTAYCSRKRVSCLFLRIDRDLVEICPIMVTACSPSGPEVSGHGITGSDAKEICFAIFWREADCEGQSILFK